MQAHLYGHPEDGASLWRMLDPIRRRLNMVRRQSGAANESLDALDYDALMLMADIAVGKDGELALTDLLELGLFPQLETATPTPDPAPASTTAGRRADLLARRRAPPPPPRRSTLTAQEPADVSRNWPAARSES